MADPDQPSFVPTDDTLPADATEAWQIEAQLPRLREQGQRDLAAALGERLLEIREATLGDAHPDTLAALGGLAEDYFQLSRHERAAPLFERLVRGREAAADTDPRDLGHALAQLAKVSRSLGALDRAEALYRRALDAFNAPTTRDIAGVASVAHGLSNLLDERGDVLEAERMCRMALEMREKLFGDRALPVAESLNSLAILRRRRGELDEAERLYLRAISIHESLRGPTHRSLATSLTNLGVLYTTKGEHAKAGEVLRRALALVDALEGPAGDALGGVLDALSVHHERMGNGDESTALARRALAIYEEAHGPTHPKVVLGLNNLGARLAAEEETRPEAEALFRRALGLVAEQSDGELLGSTLLNLAMLRTAGGDLDEAEALATRAYDLACTRIGAGADHEDAAQALTTLSHIDEKREDFMKALERMGAVMRIHGKRPTLDHGIADMTRMGELLLAEGEPGEAAKFFKNALDLAARARGKEHPSVAHLIALAGKVAVAQENPKQALFCFDRALAIEEKLKGKHHTALIELLHPMGDANLALGKLGAAEACYRRIGAIYAKNFPPDSAMQALAPALLADVATKRKDHAKAAELLDKALALAEGEFGKDSLRLQVMLDKAAEAHLAAGSLARAEELSRRLLVLYERLVPPDDPSLLAPTRRLATVYLQTGDARAEEMVKRSLGSLKAATRQVEAETAQIKADLARKKGQS